MKKINVLIISFLFLLTNNIQASLFQAPNPYSFGPQGRSVSDLRDFAKPKKMANILAGRPVVATKTDGTRVYYTPDGKMSLSIKSNGEMSFSLGGVSKNLDKYGNLKSETKTLKGNIQEVRDEFGDITSYNKLDGNGKVVATYDENMNKTSTLNYGKFGKSLEYSINEMTKQKTVYDSNERPIAVYDPEGYILTTYQYEDVSYDSAPDRKTLISVQNENKGERLLVTSKSYQNRLEGGVDSNDNIDYTMAYATTFYNRDGTTDHIDDANGVTSTVYHYEKDIQGNNVLEYVLDVKTKDRTYYENNKQSYVKDDKDFITTRYFWDGSKYLFSAQVDTQGKLTVTDKDNATAYSNIVYNKDGTINIICDERGTKILERYFYKEDSEGNNILDYVENALDGSKTYYDENGQSVKTVDKKGNVLTDYSWNNDKLVYSFDRETGVTTWYNGDQKVVYESFNNRVLSKNIYSDGQLIGKWNITHENTIYNGDDLGSRYNLTIYVNERQEFELAFREEPTVDMVRYIKNKYEETGSLDFLNEFTSGNNIKVIEFTNKDLVENN